MIAMSLVGDRAVLLELKSLGMRLSENIRTAVHRQTLALAAYVKAEKLSGQVLKNRTGTLRRKINAKFAGNATYVEGRVGAGNLPYAAAQEYGFDGVVNVKAHLRTITQAFGRELAAPMTVDVAAHQARMHLPERSFLRSGLRDRTPAIAADLEDAIRKAVAS